MENKQEIKEETLKQLYRMKSGCNESYIESNGKGYQNFKNNANYIVEELIARGWKAPEQEIEHNEKLGRFTLYHSKDKKLTVVNNGLEIQFNAKNNRWYSWAGLMTYFLDMKELSEKTDLFTRHYNSKKDRLQ